MVFTIADGKQIEIEVGDFVDIQTTIPNDYVWGRSFEVMDVNSFVTQIVIKINKSETESEETVVDTCLIVDNYTLVHEIEE